jgi:hypothetical protein
MSVPNPQDRRITEVGTTIAEALEEWRAAIREADSAAADSPERVGLEWIVERRRRDYLAAVLRLTGRKDQMEAAADATADRIARSHEIIDGYRRRY